MVDVNTVVVSVVTVLSVSYNPESNIRRPLAPPLKMNNLFTAGRGMKTQGRGKHVSFKCRLLESEGQTIKTLETAFRAEAEENHLLNLELENKQTKIETL